jgi:hypothetical protein
MVLFELFFLDLPVILVRKLCFGSTFLLARNG